MTTGEFADLVYRMRTAQKAYFRTRSSEKLSESKAYEQRVDKALEERQKRLTEKQNPGLFDEEN